MTCQPLSILILRCISAAIFVNVVNQSTLATALIIPSRTVHITTGTPIWRRRISDLPKPSSHLSSSPSHRSSEEEHYQSSSSSDGLSLFHRRLLSPTRQRFVTGKYPLFISIKDCPTKKWLSIGKSKPMATSTVYVNGTRVERSFASLDRYGWFSDDGDEEDRVGGSLTSREKHSYYSMELIAEIQMRRPGYLHLLPWNNDALHNYKKMEGKSQWWKSLTSQLEQLEAKTTTQPAIVQRDVSDGNDDLKQDLLWVTDFSLTSRGGITSVHTQTGEMMEVGSASSFYYKERNQGISFGWPNEVNFVPRQRNALTQSPKQAEEEYEDALLVTDGFLIPGRENGGLYIVSNPGNERDERKVCLAGGEDAVGDDAEWFYHRASWVDLTGDGRKSILTARAKRPSILKNKNNNPNTTNNRPNIVSKTSSRGENNRNGQLVWIERPLPHSHDVITGTPLDADGTVFDPFSSLNTPWKVRVLDEGPDVMFSVADLDTEDDTVEVIASQFFGRCLSVHSIQVSLSPRVVFRRILDDQCGTLFSSILVDLDRDVNGSANSNQNTGGGGAVVVDSGSTVPTYKPGDVVSHVLVTSHECSFDDTKASPTTSIINNHAHDGSTRHYKADSYIQTGSNIDSIDGGSLFAYRIPKHWKTDPWERTIIATGFRVKGNLWNMLNPGAPGFCYTFYPKKDDPLNTQSRPLIGISGDCAEAAYIFRPVARAPCTQYTLMCEIACGATVGSLAIGYGNFCDAEGQQPGFANIFVPNFERNKILVFSLGYEEEE